MQKVDEINPEEVGLNFGEKKKKTVNYILFLFLITSRVQAHRFRCYTPALPASTIGEVVGSAVEAQQSPALQ